MGVLSWLFDTRGTRGVSAPVYAPATEDARRVGKRTYILRYPERPYPTEPVVCAKCSGVCAGPKYVGPTPMGTLSAPFYDPMDECDLELFSESERLLWTCSCGAIIATKCADTDPAVVEVRRERPATLYVGGVARCLGGASDA